MYSQSGNSIKFLPKRTEKQNKEFQSHAKYRVPIENAFLYFFESI